MGVQPVAEALGVLSSCVLIVSTPAVDLLRCHSHVERHCGCTPNTRPLFGHNLHFLCM